MASTLRLAEQTNARGRGTPWLWSHVTGVMMFAVFVTAAVVYRATRRVIQSSG